jgi:hypothetical protein
MEIIAQTEDDGLVPRVIITSNRHQMGKTNCMVRLHEKWEEEIHGRKFHIDNLCLEVLEFMRRRKVVPEWTPLDLDEPERPVGNKTWYTEEAQLFVEDLMTSPWKHIPAMFALPHSHYLNNSIFGVSTSQIVKNSKTHATLYELERDQLNRNFKTYTRAVGEFDLDPAYAWDWDKYMKKREAFDTKRGKMLEDKVASLQTMSMDLTKEMVYQIVIADQKRFTDKKTKEISTSAVEAELGVSYAKANFASTKAKRIIDERNKAEKQA